MSVTGHLMRGISPARVTAFEVLKQVDAGAYVSDALRASSHRLPSRDAGLAATVVFGCLRYQAQLDYLISMHSDRRAEKLDLEVLVSLRMGIFQLRYLARVPPHAVVHDSVEIVKRTKKSAAGLTNAILRKVNRNPVNWPDRATELSCPAWLLSRWSEQFGSEAADSIARAALEEPDPYIRIVPGGSPPPDLHVESTSVPGAYRVLSELPVGIRLHDIGSQAIIPLLDLQAGCSYLDLCAAPGNKTVQALESQPGIAIACDVSWHRLRQVAVNCPRVVLDATQELPFKRKFDRVFVDAPCSGTGTLARNPEIKWRLNATELPRFRDLQSRILLNAASALAERGKLVYATCSLQKEENEDVVRGLLARHPAFRLVTEQWRIPGRDPGDGFYAASIVAEARSETSPGTP